MLTRNDCGRGARFLNSKPVSANTSPGMVPMPMSPMRRYCSGAGTVCSALRMASTRFPGKPLTPLLGRPMIQWVVEAAEQAALGADVVVATPDVEIAEVARDFGAEVEMTSIDHPSGTDRIAEVASRRVADLYVNVQGDEPLIDPRTIAACAAPLLVNDRVEMSSCWVSLDADHAGDPSMVKVVLAENGEALYFSRSPIPHPRDAAHAVYRKHLGIYAYRRETLARFATWPTTALERAEGLEQLRFLEHGVRIRMAHGFESGLAVDLPEHAAQVEALLRERSEISPA
ncbi:3-deoxy-manno-octulosonate cytidylyltransferase [bacterium]|nr:MAG: 3-deoxy-manno-octulosonate cytidylyltransferase [bacterium]